MGDQAEQLQGDGLIGLGLQYLFVEALRLGQPARRMVLKSLIYSLLEGRRRWL